MVSDSMKNVLFEDRVLTCLGTWSGASVAMKCFREISGQGCLGSCCCHGSKLSVIYE